MTSPATGVDWAAAGLTPEMSDQIFKTAQGAWTNSPAGRRYEMMRSIMPTLVSVQGQKDILRMKEDMAEGNLKKAVSTAKGMRLPPEIQRYTPGMSSMGDLIEATRDVDTAMKIVNVASALDYHQKSDQYRIDANKRSQIDKERDDLRQSLGQLGTWAKSFITPAEIADAQETYADDPKGMESWLAQRRLEGRVPMPPEIAPRFDMAEQMIDKLYKSLFPDLRPVASLEELRKRAAAEDASQPGPVAPAEAPAVPTVPPPMLNAMNPSLSGVGPYEGNWQKELADHIRRGFEEAAKRSPF